MEDSQFYETYIKKKQKYNNPLNPSQYKNPFTYYESKSLYKELNFIYILDKKTLTNFENQIGIFDHEMHEDLGSASDIQKFDNTLLLDKKKITKINFFSNYPFFQNLNNLLLEVEEEDFIFLHEKVFKMMQKKIKDIKKIQKVLFSTHDGLKIEIYNPVVNILFINNDFINNKKFSVKNYKNFILQIPISKYMHGHDLNIILKEQAVVKFKTIKYDLESSKILLPEENEINSKMVKNLLKGHLYCEDITNINFSNLDIYEKRLLIFIFKDNINNWKINYKVKEDKNKFCINCARCEKDLDEIRKKKFCICGAIYCNSNCKRNDKGHKCKNKKCGYCNKYLSKEDVYSMTLCKCGLLYCEEDCYEKDKDFHEENCPAPKSKKELKELNFRNDGKIGLSNIGNTCYMNSALQCILHNNFLKDFFLSCNYVKDINKTNPLGTKGELLKELGKLYLEFWSSRRYKIAPSNFKRKLTDHLSTFEGYSQHDSQEFLSQLLDSVHEDLNRIINKPYTTTIEGKVTDIDEIIARKSWVNFLKRNYSPIIDNFYGQYKSLLICPDCNNSSVTFDPFQLISLSIPTVSKQDFDFYYIGADHIGKAERFSFVGKSLHKFRDISLCEIIDNFCGKLKLDEKKQVFAALGFSAVGEVCGKNENLARIYEMRVLMRSKPKIFLCGLNEHEIEIKKKKDCFPIYLKSNYEVFDVDEDEKKTYAFDKKTRKFNEDPVFTKFVFADHDMEIRDLYIMVFRKYFHVTNLSKGYKPKTMLFSEYKEIWKKIENKKNLQFFYLKTNDKILKITDTTKLIDLKGKSHKLVIKVFLKTKKNTDVDIDLDYFVNCTSNHEICPKFSSKDLNSYKGEYSLQYLLENFEKPEILDQENAWYCSKCKNHVQATKTIHIYKIPKYLIIHLKKLKISAKKVPLVTFPIKSLKMSKFVLNKNCLQNYKVKAEEFYPEKDLEYYKKKNLDLIFSPDEGEVNMDYKLCGVVNHYGSQHFGHYTATVEYEDGKWADFNDSSVSDEEIKNVVGEGAYVLFYKRKD